MGELNHDNVRYLETSRDALTGLQEWMLGQQLRPGDELPTERDLARSLGVGRARVRDAVRVLEVAGVLEPVSAGAATTTIDPATELGRLLRLHLSLSGFDSTDLLSIRIELERSSVARAAAEATAADLDELRRVVAAMARPAVDHAQFRELDCRFHVRLAAAAHNGLAAALLASLEDPVKQGMSVGYAGTANWPATAARLAEEHHRILEAVEGGDPEFAERQVTQHLTDFYEAKAS